jgi:hypothetical protein
MTTDELADLWGVNPRKRVERLRNIGRMRRYQERSGRTRRWRHLAIAEATL